jgi:hypothetical protein
MGGVAGRSGRPPLAKPRSPQTGPIKAIEVRPNGKLRPLTYWGGKGLADVRMISGRFLLSFQDLWELGLTVPYPLLVRADKVIE